MTIPVFTASTAWSAKAAVLNHLAPDTGFMEDNFSADWRREDGLGMIQAHDIYCTLYLDYDYVSSTSGI